MQEQSNGGKLALSTNKPKNLHIRGQQNKPQIKSHNIYKIQLTINHRFKTFRKSFKKIF